MTPEIRPVPTEADFLRRARLWRLQDALVSALLRREPERFYLPAWEGGPSAAAMNMELYPSHEAVMRRLLEELEA